MALSPLFHLKNTSIQHFERIGTVGNVGMCYCAQTEIKLDIIISGESTQFISMFSIDTYTRKYSMNVNTFTHPESVSLRLNNYSYKI